MKTNKALTYGDLKDQTGTIVVQPCLRCDNCNAEFSANSGDYWQQPKDAEIICGECQEPLRLVTKQTVFVPVNA
jgi:hypothetical protein